MRIEVVSLFPEWVQSLVTVGMPRIAVERGALQLGCWQPRDYADNRWRKVDERPFGGGPGMVMQPVAMSAAIAAARNAAGGKTAPVVLMSPQGERFSQAWAQKLAAMPGMVLVCGRYEGLDERLLQTEIDVELSLGDFVLSGGELAAMAVIDAVARLLPGVLGDAESAACDSFSHGLLDHPHYTRPEVWKGQSAPEVLLGGDHQAIARWRTQRALAATWLKRPDLLANVALTEAQRRALREIIAEQLA